MPLLSCPVCHRILSTPPRGQVPILLRCPYCQFLGIWDGEGGYGIPTYEEEQRLPVADGILHGSEPPDSREETLSEEELPPLPLPYKRRLYLKVLTGPERGNILPLLEGRVILGRGGEVVIKDRRVSRKHAVIEAISRENIYIRDLMSRNGTYVNGVKIQTYKLKAGDIIRLGDTDLEFLIEDEP